jgi:hypothetical protein
MSCPDCFKGSVHSHAGQAKGKQETLYGKTCYVALPPSTSSSPSVIIYLTDSFGLNLINTKILADRFAAETGCKVLVPDVIPGGGGPVSLMGYMEILQTHVPLGDVSGQLRRISAVFALAYYFVPFSLRILTWAAPQRAYPKNILPFAQAVKADLPPGAKLAVVGFCWGEYGSTRLCTESAVKGGSERMVEVQFCGHPYNLKTPATVCVCRPVPHITPVRYFVPDRQTAEDRSVEMTSQMTATTPATMSPSATTLWVVALAA